MDFLSKVQKVKDYIAQWQKKCGDDFDYVVNEFATEDEDGSNYDVFISKNEHQDILKYLASTGYLEITQNGSDSPHIKILPKTKPTIRLKSLELIARDIGNLDTGSNLVSFLIESGVDKRLIVYPNTKWRMVYAVLIELACSKNDRDKETLFKIIGNAVHPLMHRGNTVSAEFLQSKFNDYLSYDNLELFYNKKEGVYKVIEPLSEDEKKEIIAEIDGRVKRHLEFLFLPENKEKISLLRKTYQALMGVVELFCRNFLRLSQEEIVELNKHYLALDRTVWDIIDELGLGGAFENYKKYPRPFINLFSAEKELDGDISWDVIRREMSARFGEIETLYQRVNASDILAEPDKQKQLNDVMLYLSKLKEKTKEAEKEDDAKILSTTKIEITKIPELQIKGFEEKVLSQKSNKPSEKSTISSRVEDKYEISVKDREIWVNDYLIGKPHAVGSNFDFFEYIRSQKPNAEIKRKALPNLSGTLSLKEQVKSKSFIKIANELGFKGEILKAFFYNRGKDTITYRGDQITKEDLEKAGIKIPLFLKELELANTKNSPE